MSIISEKSKIAKRFNKVEPKNEVAFTPNKHFSGFNLPKLPIVMANKICFMHWGLVPNWANNTKSLDKWAISGLNAKIETLTEKPYFKEAYKQTAILPCNGFYEWQHLSNGSKQLWFIRSKESEICSLAVIYQYSNKVTVEPYKSFAMLTTKANNAMALVHNTKERMPILLSKKDEEAWLNAKTDDEIFSILNNPLPENKWELYPISNLYLKQNLQELNLPKPIILPTQQSLF